MPQADAAVRALQQAGNLHHHEVLPPVSNHAQHRLYGGEGVVGNLGLGGGAPGDQRGLAGVGLGQQTDVGQQLQLQPEHRVVALLAGLGEHRLLVGGRHEAGIAPTPLATLRDEDGLFRRDVGQEVLAAVRVHAPDHGAHGNGYVAILAVAAALVLALAVGATLQVEGAVELEVQQRIDGVVAYDVSAAAVAAITAIRSASGLVLEPEEADAAVAPISGFNVNSYSVNHRLCLVCR